MNFMAVRATPGTFVTMPAVPTGIELKEGDYGPYAFATLTDDMGESIKILIGANAKSPLPQPNAEGMRSKFGVKYDLNTQKYKAYYNGLLQTQPGQQQPPQGGTPGQRQPDAHPQGKSTGEWLQGFKPPQNGNKDRLIVAQVVYKSMMNHQPSFVVDEPTLSHDVDMIMRVGSNQPAPTVNPDYDENPAPPTDDIPF